MQVVLLTTDLMTASQVSGAAREAGAKLRVAASPLDVQRHTEELPADLVILDLTCPAAVPSTMVEQLRQLSPVPGILAFGPHVHAEKLAAAKSAGCDEVLSRGQFFSKMDQIFCSDEHE